jgi:hypothetical protein
VCVYLCVSWNYKGILISDFKYRNTMEIPSLAAIVSRRV